MKEMAMYGPPQHAQTSTRLAGVSATAVFSALVIWGIITGVGAKVIVPIQRIMEVAITTPPRQQEKIEPPKPIDADLKPTMDAPPPLPLPDFDFKADEAAPVAPEPVAAASPSNTPTALAPDAKPRLITTTKPPYPPSAIRDKQQGRTSLQLCVDR